MNDWIKNQARLYVKKKREPLLEVPSTTTLSTAFEAKRSAAERSKYARMSRAKVLDAKIKRLEDWDAGFEYEEFRRELLGDCRGELVCVQMVPLEDLSSLDEYVEQELARIHNHNTEAREHNKNLEAWLEELSV